MQTAHSELEKTQNKVSRMLEDMINRMYSPTFAQKVTADYAVAVAELQKDVDGLKSRAGLPVEPRPELPPAKEVSDSPCKSFVFAVRKSGISDSGHEETVYSSAEEAEYFQGLPSAVSRIQKLLCDFTDAIPH